MAACQSAWAAARLVTSGGLQLLQFGKQANPTDARNAGLGDERSEGGAASQPSAPSSKATIAFGEEFLYKLKAGPPGGRPRPADYRSFG